MGRITKTHRATLLFPLFLIGGVLLATSMASHGQVEPGSKLEAPPPNTEKFGDAPDLIAPWRDTGCRGNACAPGSRLLTVREFAAAHRLALYNADASVWYSFSVDPLESDYFLRNTKPEFRPFAIYPGEPAPDAVILRLARESAHWYEVEINEISRQTRYILKSDPMWARTTWEYWLLRDHNLQIDGAKVKLLDKPDGKIIDASLTLSFESVKFLKAEDDWAFVEGTVDGIKFFRGWVRWRKGRDILVGSAFNQHRYPR